MEGAVSSEVMSGSPDEVSEEGNSDINAASQDVADSGGADASLQKKRMMAMKCQVKDLNDKSKGEIELKDSVFAVEPRKRFTRSNSQLAIGKTPIRHAQGKTGWRYKRYHGKTFSAKGHR